MLLGSVIAMAQAPVAQIDQPLAIHFTDSSLPSVANDNGTALFIVSGTERIALTIASSEAAGEGLRLKLRSDDGRGGSAVLTFGPEGATRLRVTVEEKGEFEKFGIAFQVGKKEGFYGLMERVVSGSQGFSWEPGMTEGLNLRGQVVDLYTLPTVSIYAPFFVSSAGYGVLVESDWPGLYRFGVTVQGAPAPSTITIEQEGPELSVLLLPGPTPLDVVERYARITGLPMDAPDFLFGPGRWRDVVWNLPTWYDGTACDGPFNSMILEDILMMDALGIPCSWYVVDRPWAAGSFGYGGMVFDEQRLPEIERMIDWLDGRGIATLLWLGPWVMDEQRDTAIDRSFNVPLTIPYLPNAALIDFTNPDAFDWWAGELDPLFEMGFAGFKLDRGEEKPPDGQLFRGFYADGTPYREGHNAYPHWFAEAAKRAAEQSGAVNFVNFYRAGWVGSSQYTVAWGGDTDPSSWGLRSAIIAGQRAAFLNTPIWGSDTGGYNERPPREVLARWLAFSAFCPIMEVGPTANLAPWSWLPDDSGESLTEAGYDFETVYDEELLAIWAMYAQIHSDLELYTADLADLASVQGTPIIRPLVLAYPDDARFVDAFEQYLFGPDLLVRPIWEEDATSVEVLLPEGTWIDAWTGVSHSGPGSISIETPLHVVPLFTREDGSGDLADLLGDLDSRWRAAQAAVAQPDTERLIQTMQQERTSP